MSKNTRINIIYSTAWIFGFILLFVSLAMYNPFGALAYIAITTICGIVALSQKHRTNVWWSWVLLVCSPGVFYPVAVLCLHYRPARRRAYS